jgi:DNA-binding GntR family transcriptional regulator
VSLTRTVLRDQIREILLKRILSGEYAPGDRLVELQLAREFGTSQSPVREALRELELLRFVDSEAYKGTRVRAVSAEELAEIYPVRAALEDYAAREAAKKLDGKVAELEKEFEEMIRAAGEGDLLTLAQHDVRFHELIVEAAGNGILLETWRSLRVQARTIITALKADVDLMEIAEMHRPLLVALAERSPEEAGKALRWHFEVLQSVIKRGDGKP